MRKVFKTILDLTIPLQEGSFKSLLTYTKDKQIKVLFDTTTYQPSFEADLTIIVYASLKEIKARMKDRVRKLPEKSVVSSWNKIYQPEEILEIEK